MHHCLTIRLTVVLKCAIVQQILHKFDQFPRLSTLLRNNSENCEKSFGLSPYYIREAAAFRKQVRMEPLGGKNEFPFHIKGSNGLRYHLITETVNVNELPLLVLVNGNCLLTLLNPLL